jgi:hypothetical protein
MTDPHEDLPAWVTRPELPAAPAQTGPRRAPRPPSPVRLAGAHTPAWAARTVVGLGVLAGASLVGVPMGLGLAVVLLALGATAAAVRRPAILPTVDLRTARQPLGGDAWTRVWWAFAAALALVPVLRAATWVVLPSLLAAAALASLAVSGGRRWGELGAGLGALWARLPHGAVLAGRVSGRGVSVRVAGPAARGAALAAVLLAVFVPLLVSADAAFAQILETVLPTGWSVDRPVGRAFVLALVVAAGGALVYTRLRPPAPAPRGPRRTLGRVEWALPLGVLVAVLGAFVALQLATLFGGQRHVLDTAGLTYAEYAREGFAQLIAVAALTLAVIAAAGRWARDGGTLLRVLLAALCLLTLVVLASALKRLGLYEETYGFTRLRLAAHAALLYLGALFCLVLAARTAAWLPRAVVAVTAAAVLTFALADPDRRIADHNADRFARTGKIDLRYMASLGADAAPALTRIPGAACELRVPDGGLAGLNLARARARRALADCDAPRTRTAR